MSDRVVTIHAFCSVKGGVGKSTLAVACAKLLAESGRKPVLIDADLTGTSLADGLRLCAPELATRQDGGADLEAPTGRRLSRAETVAARRARADTPWTEIPPPPPFLNDILIHGHELALYDEDLERECTVEPLLWRHEKDDGVAYLPSSPLRADVEIALGWLYRARQFTWIRRMTWLLEGMREQMSDLTDVVIDLPPGMFGFSHEVLALMAPSGEVTLLHLAFHRDMKAGPPGPAYSWLELPIHRKRLPAIRALCRRLVERYVGGSDGIPFGVRYAGARFALSDGHFLPHDGHGLTCATFVLAVFASHGFPLLKIEEWPEREDDREWHAHVLNMLHDHCATQEEIRAVKDERGCARFRPQEVAAAGAVDELPLRFEEARRIGELLVEALLTRHAQRQ